MTVMLKVQNTKFLETLGVPGDMIASMEGQGVKVLIGWTDVHFVDHADNPLISCKFSKSTNDVMKGNVPVTIMEGMKSQVIEALKVAVNKAASIKSTNGNPKPLHAGGKEFIAAYSGLGKTPAAEVTAKVKESVAKAKSTVKAWKAPTGDAKMKVMSGTKVRLRDADRLYQPVYGTSHDAKYFVVALHADVRLACKIEGNSVSIRAEGNLTNEVKTALSKVGLGGLKEGKGGAYLSGHFDCAQSTPERLIGAVLAGTGLEFETPMPSITAIKNFSAGDM